MRARELMRRNPPAVTPSERITHAAELMHYETDACIPVVRDAGVPILVGIITARDIAVRCVARRHGVGCRVADHMTPMPLYTASPDDELGEVIDRMETADVRRIPVVSDDGLLLGVVREADARHAAEQQLAILRREPSLGRSLVSGEVPALLAH
jgi:CBS domain-containing protein